MKGCRPLTDTEIREVVDSFYGTYAARDRALFILGIKSGFRVSELLSLRVKDVVSGDHIMDRVTVCRRNMKRKTEGRTVLMHPDAKAALQEWIDELQDEPDSYIFQSRKGGNKPISRYQAYRILRTLYEDCGLDGRLGTHTMRKTFADRVYKNLGNDLVKTQRALGHKNIHSTMSYMSFKDEDVDQAILAI